MTVWSQTPASPWCASVTSPAHLITPPTYLINSMNSISTAMLSILNYTSTSNLTQRWDSVTFHGLCNITLNNELSPKWVTDHYGSYVYHFYLDYIVHKSSFSFTVCPQVLAVEMIVVSMVLQTMLLFGCHDHSWQSIADSDDDWTFHHLAHMWLHCPRLEVHSLEHCRHWYFMGW